MEGQNKHTSLAEENTAGYAKAVFERSNIQIYEYFLEVAWN